MFRTILRIEDHQKFTKEFNQNLECDLRKIIHEANQNTDAVQQEFSAYREKNNDCIRNIMHTLQEQQKTHAEPAVARLITEATKKIAAQCEKNVYTGISKVNQMLATCSSRLIGKCKRSLKKTLKITHEMEG